LFDFNEYTSTKIFFGKDSISELSQSVSDFGKRCIIVTGRSGAQKSGALQDIESVLSRHNISYCVFSAISENPALSEAIEAGRMAVAESSEFVIGIGGGSAIDAAKAAAMFISNPDILNTPMKLFLETESLKCAAPIIAVPTTAGTGTEANRYSVITIDGTTQKKSFKTDNVIPRIAVLNPKYTASLPPKYAMGSALDAFCHCAESYMSPKSTEKSETMAILGAGLLIPVLRTKHIDSSDKKVRSDLLTAALAGGIAINTTGTGFPHPFGYTITIDFGVPHGHACACFYGQYVKYCMSNTEGKERMYDFCSKIGSSPDELASLLPELSGVHFSLSDSVIDNYLVRVSSSVSHENCFYKLTDADKRAVFTALFSAK